MEDYLGNEYVVVSMDFQGISTAECQDEFIFTKAYMRMFMEALEDSGATADEMKPVTEFVKNREQNILGEMFNCFSADQIAAMLEEYEADNHTGMEIAAVAEEIYRYLISWIWKTAYLPS